MWHDRLSTYSPTATNWCPKATPNDAQRKPATETTAALVPVVSVANPNLTPGTTKKGHKKAQVGSKTAQKVIQDSSHRAQGGPI